MLMQSTIKMCLHCTKALPDIQSLGIDTKANPPSIGPAQLTKAMQSTTKTSSNSIIGRSDIDPRGLVIRPKADSPFATKAACSDLLELNVLKDQLRKLLEQFKKATNEDEKINISMRICEMVDSYEIVDIAEESKEDLKPEEDSNMKEDSKHLG